MAGAPPSARPRTTIVILAGMALLALLLGGMAAYVEELGSMQAGRARPSPVPTGIPPATGTPPASGIPPASRSAPGPGVRPSAPPSTAGLPADPPAFPESGPPPPPSAVPPRVDPAWMERLREAVRLGLAARSGDPAAMAAAAERRAGEPDPRLRQALATGEPPHLGEFRRRSPSLPAAARPAEPGHVDAYWLTPKDNGTYQSSIDIDADGRARVETVVEGDPRGPWHVRYEAWAWRDAQGNLVIDSRGQDVDVLACPPGSWWSPDSMVIAPGGTVELIDDKCDPGQGTLGGKGAG